MMAHTPSLRTDRTSNTQQSLRSIRNSHERNCNKYTLVALGMILLIGSLIASGCLYADVGHWSLAIGAGGLIVGIALIVGGLCCNRKPPSQPHPKEKPHLEKEEKKPALENRDEEKRIPYYRSAKPLQAPIRASDIKDLPATLPNYSRRFVTQWGLTPDTEGLHIVNLDNYTTYLATQFPGIVALSPGQRATLWNVGWTNYSIDELEDYIFKHGPETIKNFNNLNLPTYLVVPGNHWTLVYIDRVKRTVEYYDSKIMNLKTHTEIVQKLTKIAVRLSQQEHDKPPYRVEDKIHKVLQTDSINCGVWALYFLEGRLINSEFNFNQLEINETEELIKKYRKKVGLILLEMGEAFTVADQTERENYRRYYSDEELAEKMYDEDLSRFSLVDRWKRRLHGPLLDPSQQV
jgi:hypothetical protein